METFYSPLPALALLPSLAAVPLILASGKHPNVREFWTLAAAFIKFAIVLALLPLVLQHDQVECRLFFIAHGAELVLRVDRLGILFGLVASTLWIVTSFYSIGYMRGHKEANQTRYFAAFAMCLFGTLGIAFAGNLITFLIAYEVLTIATYPLVVHAGTPKAIAAGRKYLCYTLSAGLAMTVAVLWAWTLAGTMDFRAGGFLKLDMASPMVLGVVFLLFMIGAGVKAGLMPLHPWLPSAMVAPTPVSALLHAVAVVKAGVFATARIVGFVFGPEVLRGIGAWQVLAAVAGFTLVAASLIALRQDNLKARLAYSTVGHLAYIVLGCALLSHAGWTGGLLHIVNHATMKITLFFCAGAIAVHAHKTEISQLDGIGRRMPVTMTAFAIASLGLAGVPPVNGFVSKWLLCAGALEAHRGIFLVLLLFSGVLNAAYFFPIVHRAFFRGPAGPVVRDEASAWMVVPLALTALASLWLGLWPHGPVDFYAIAEAVARSVVGGGPV